MEEVAAIAQLSHLVGSALGGSSHELAFDCEEFVLEDDCILAALVEEAVEFVEG